MNQNVHEKETLHRWEDGTVLPVQNLASLVENQCSECLPRRAELDLARKSRIMI